MHRQPVRSWWQVSDEVLLAIEPELVNKEPSQVTFLWFTNCRILTNKIHLILDGKLQRSVSLFDELLERRFVVPAHALILAH